MALIGFLFWSREAFSSGSEQSATTVLVSTTRVNMSIAAVSPNFNDSLVLKEQCGIERFSQYTLLSAVVFRRY